MKLRLWILLFAFVAELGAIYGIQDDNQAIVSAVQSSNNQGTYIRIEPGVNESHSDFLLPELAEENEINETDHTEDDLISHGLPQYFFFSGIEYFRSFKLPFSESGPANGLSCPLFVRFHCWKFHLL